MLEKPPAATTRQIALLADEAARCGRTLFQSWHSRFAAGVDGAREFLRTRTLVGGQSDVDWRPFQLVADAFLVGERLIVAPHQI